MTSLKEIADARAALTSLEEDIRADPRLERRRQQAVDHLTQLRSQLLAAAADPLTLADGRYPLLLLPVGLETRFAWQDANDPTRRTFTRPRQGSAIPLLLVRVLPDHMHIHGHDPALSFDESLWLNEFLARTEGATDREPFVAAWEQLIRRAGPQRAAWIVHASRAGAPAAGSRWGRAPRASLLPDRWVARAWVDGQSTQAVGELVREPIDVAPDPVRAGPGAEGLSWMVHFDEAVRAGMALVIPLPGTSGGAPTVQRLIVVGAHVSRDADASTLALEELLDAHHYSDGLSFVRPGAPTNALPGERPDRTSRPSAPDIFAIEGDMFPLTRATTLVDDRPADGLDAAFLLGLNPAIFGHVAGADGRWRQAGRDMRRLLAAANLGSLQYLLNPLVGPQDLADVAFFFVDALDGLGPMPALRVGDQPYGVLPVSAVDPEDSDLDPFQRRLARVLNLLRSEVWEPSAAKLHRIGGPPRDPIQPPPDPTATLLTLLRSDGVTRTLTVRPVLGQQVAGAVATTLDQGRLGTLATASQALRDLLNRLAGRPAAQAPLAQLLLLAEATPVRAPLVQPAQPGPGQSVHEYLELLSFRVPGTGPSLLDLAEENLTLPGDRPQAFLYALARLALLSTADRVSRKLLRDAQVVDDGTVAAWESELNHGPAGPTLLYELPARLNSTLPTLPLEPIHFLLLTAAPEGSGPFLDALEAVRWLASPPGSSAARPNRYAPDLLETVLRSELGLLSHRLDAWFTGLATWRLQRLRNSPGLERRLVVGGYGLLLDISPAHLVDPLPPSELPPGESGEVFRNRANAGYVHAPSVAHAATAAVLRSAHLAQWQAVSDKAAGDVFSIDLSSRRVRTALGLLDGIREGQPLAALLGYRIERLLRGAGAPQGIAVIRRAAPLVAGRLTPGGPTEHVAADNVVDGVSLVELAGAGDAATVSTVLQPHLGGLTGSDGQHVVDGVVAAVADAREALDAVADLLTAEGVFQLVRGNPARSAGSVDAISGSSTPPPEPEVVASARSGVALTQRVAVALPADGPEPADERAGWARTARVSLEPALERWARAVLPAPAAVQVSFTDEPGGAPTFSGSLAALQEAAGNAGATSLRLGALDVVAAAGPDARAALEARLVAMARHIDPSVLIAGVLFTRPPTLGPAASSLAEILEAGNALRTLLLEGRPLRPEDFAPPGASAATVTSRPAVDRVDALAGVVGSARDTLLAALETARGHLTSKSPTPDATLATDRAALLDALLSADALGAGQAVPIGPLLNPSDPSVDLAALVPLAAAVDAELSARINAAAALAAPAAGEPARAAWACERARTLLGPSGWLLPALDPPTPGESGPLDVAVPAGATGAAARLVLARYALVRPGVARLDRVLGHVEALDGSVPALTVTQRPLSPGERWVALQPLAGQRIAGGRVAVLAHRPFPGEAGPLAALLVDDWTEVVPSTDETTSLSFHYDAPSSAPPNVLLLGVPRPNQDRWSTDAAITVVEEALTLARLRAVDPDALTGAGQLVPAFLSLEQTSPGISASLGAARLTEAT